MLLMINIFHLIVKKGLGIGLGLLSIVTIHLPIKSLMLKPSRLFTEAHSGPELSRIPIKGLLMMEGRKIISLTKNPLNIQPQVHQTHLLSISNPRHDDSPTSSKPLPEFNPEYLIGRTFLLPPADNGERLRAKVTRKLVEDIEEADGERFQNLGYILNLAKWKNSYPITNLWII